MPEDRIRLSFVCILHISSTSSQCRLICRYWTYKFPARYTQSSECVRLFSYLNIFYAIYGAFYFQLTHFSITWTRLKFIAYLFVVNGDKRLHWRCIIAVTILGIVDQVLVCLGLLSPKQRHRNSFGIPIMSLQVDIGNLRTNKTVSI